MSEMTLEQVRMQIAALGYSSDREPWIMAIESAQAELTELRALNARLKLEAKIHAQEARTANAKIAEIYRVVSDGKGEPGNWNGAEPVRKAFAELRAIVARLREPVSVNDAIAVDLIRENLGTQAALNAYGKRILGETE